MYVYMYVHTHVYVCVSDIKPYICDVLGWIIWDPILPAIGFLLRFLSFHILIG